MLNPGGRTHLEVTVICKPDSSQNKDIKIDGDLLSRIVQMNKNLFVLSANVEAKRANA